MKYKAGLRRRAREYEVALIEYWREKEIFEKSIAQRDGANSFTFYDGPPFLTGTPHYGHLMVSTIKDAVARYQTMRGKRVERGWGWDCHGLPAERFVQGKLGIENSKEIGSKISVEEFVRECRAAMVKTGTEWEDTISRLGRWVDMNDAYKTMDNDYMESVWWAFKELYEKGKIYEGEKILVYCTNDATPISKSEVAMENAYQMDTDPSLFVYFKLDGVDEYMLAWTTTPWTLLANVVLAIDPEMEYALVRYEDKDFYIASVAVERVLVDEKKQPLKYEILKTVKGEELVGRGYEPIAINRGVEAHRVLGADFVTAEEGTGIVHVAPAYGEDDYELGKKNGLPIVSVVDENGEYVEGEWAGKNIWAVNKEIAKDFVAKGKALKVEYIKHEYPHCHRCGEKLMYRAHPSWFMDVDGQRREMLEQAKTTRWVPEHVGNKRFNNIVEVAPDWNLSRDRYWATPIPAWKGMKSDGTSVVKVVGSFAELEKLAGVKLDDYHLPNVLGVEFEYEGVKMRHIGKVLDCWFESGSMPFAQFHYPFENKAKFEQNFPADFITEAIDQTRGWFYALLAVNVALFGRAPWKNLICSGLINAADGKKMSKKLKNYTDPMELFDKYSVDAFRFTVLASPLTNGENFAMSDKAVSDTARKLGMIWNMYDFFTMYAEVDDWEYEENAETVLNPKELTNPLDKWIVSRVHELREEITRALDVYDFSKALASILPFVDDASNWFVRRSRRRFWKSEDDGDKNDAYRTLHYVLVCLSRLLAPFTPFLAEELYQKLTGGESVHLLDWPETRGVDKKTIEEMARVRWIIEQGLSVRMNKDDEYGQIKVRQPLVSLTYGGKKLTKFYEQTIAEEVNVKEVKYEERMEEGIYLEKKLTEELKREGLMRELIRFVQNARKNAGLSVDDRIKLAVRGEVMKELSEELLKIVKEETLAVKMTDDEYDYHEIVKIDGGKAEIFIEKV